MIRPVPALLAVLVACAPAVGQAAQPPPSPSPAPSGSPAASPNPLAENAQTTKLARSEFDAWKAGQPNLSLYAPGTDKYFTDTVKQQVKAFLTGMGDVQSFAFTGKTKLPNGILADVYTAKGASGTVTEYIRIDDKGKIDLIYFAPAKPSM